jgi:hypothetical protein
MKEHHKGVSEMRDWLERAHAGCLTMLHRLGRKRMVRLLGFRLPPHTRMGIDAGTRARRACPGQRRQPTRLVLQWGFASAFLGRSAKGKKPKADKWNSLCDTWRRGRSP